MFFMARTVQRHLLESGSTVLLKVLRILVVPMLALWLAAWIVLSWPAIQDDALIHLRYADFLYSRHFITFDGVHPSFGASSLLYVGLLAVLRSFTASPLLSRAVSSTAHVVLFLGLCDLLLERPAHGVGTRAAAYGVSAAAVGCAVFGALAG